MSISDTAGEFEQVEVTISSTGETVAFDGREIAHSISADERTAYITPKGRIAVVCEEAAGTRLLDYDDYAGFLGDWGGSGDADLISGVADEFGEKHEVVVVRELEI